MINKEKVIPKLRFSGFEDEWIWDYLMDLSEISTGNKDLKDKVEDGQYPFFVRSANVERINSYSYDGEAVLIPGDGNVGRIYHYIDGKFDYHQRVYKISDFSDEILGKYVYYYLSEKFLKQVYRNSQKASVDSLRMPTIQKMKIKYPSNLKEQKKIISLFSAVDIKINLLKNKHQYYQDFKKYLMQQIFSQNLKFIFKGEWKLIKLGDVTNINTGKKDVKDKKDDGKYPFFVRSEKVERIDSYSYDGEAILIPGDGKIGEVYHYINGKFDYHQRVYKISDFDVNIHGKYIYYYLEKNFLRQAMKNTAKATVDSLRLDTLTKMPIEVPSLEEQIKIADVLTIMDDKIQLIEENINSIEGFKKGLLQQMFV